METNLTVAVLKQSDGKWSAKIKVESTNESKKFQFNRDYKDIRDKQEIWQLVKDFVQLLSIEMEGF